MTPNADEIWAWLVRLCGKAKGFAPLSPEEAQRELDAAPEEPISEEQIDAIVRAVTGREPTLPTSLPDEDWAVEPLAAKGVGEEVLQLNRNVGEEDPEVERLLDEYRRKALEQDSTEDDDQPDGMEDDPGTP